MIMEKTAGRNSTIVCRRESLQDCGNAWDGDFWRGLPVIPIDQFHPQSSVYRPESQAKIAHDGQGIAVCFKVQDRYVICRHTEFMSPVCQDSCVEVFFKPDGANGYFNIEINIGGTLHASYIRDNTRTEGGFRDWTPLTVEDSRSIRIFPSHPGVLEGEIDCDLEWRIGVYLPFRILARYCGEVAFHHDAWSGNFYKCVRNNSHPHWASWTKIELLDFHQPQYFGMLLFRNT